MKIRPKLILNALLIGLLTSCGTMYREPNGYQDRRLPVAGRCSDPDCAISPFSGQHVDVHGIPYGMVVSDPSTGREFIFLEPRKPVYEPSYVSSTQPITDYAPSPSYVPPPPQKTQEEILADARRDLVVSLALRMGGNKFQPDTLAGVIGKGLTMCAVSYGIEKSLEILMPEASNTERIVVKAVLVSFADLKFTPEEISQQVTKDVFMAELAKENPTVAQNIEVASTAWDLMSESIKVANKQ
jgi:hypothetical protein